MHARPNQMKVSLSAIVFTLVLAFSTAAQALQLENPKKVQVGDDVVITVKDMTEGDKLEITISSRSLEESIILPVENPELRVENLVVGHYVIGLRRVGEIKLIDMSAITITQVPK